MYQHLKSITTIICLLIFSTFLHAEEKPESPGMPPAKVVVAQVTAGMVAPACTCESKLGPVEKNPRSNPGRVRTDTLRS